jgi:hypothetical protein
MVALRGNVSSMEHKTPLKEWLVRNDRTASWLGRQIGVGPTQAADIVAGRKKPSLAQRIAFEVVTGGDVTRENWT